MELDKKKITIVLLIIAPIMVLSYWAIVLITNAINPLKNWPSWLYFILLIAFIYLMMKLTDGASYLYDKVQARKQKADEK